VRKKNKEKYKNEYHTNYYDFLFLFIAGCEYVDMIANPEQYTGFSGREAHTIWQAIYNENCFMFASGVQEQCIEQNVFYKLISGLHASISVHICSQYLNSTTGLWFSNEQCFSERVGNYPDRLANMRFLYSLLVRAFDKLSPSLKSAISTGDSENDAKITDLLTELSSVVKGAPVVETGLFKGKSQELLSDFRDKFRNISMIMDCINCQKCRLWGKTQITGLGTAMKIVFSPGNNVPKLSRYEFVALIQVMHKLAESINDSATTFATSKSRLKNEDLALIFCVTSTILSMIFATRFWIRRKAKLAFTVSR
jgi:Endoplasmic Reticulum Oxidoreductin 1 (ERO1)